ncbi:MAG TPA: 2OG-Fe(II) oxygenase, partial [Gammaproteobacteria bacterium]|nr:2OG-Fe(II) oxygenase [Gammaproteobacteria bacterium]
HRARAFETIWLEDTDLVVSGKEHWKDIDRALFQSLGKVVREFRASFPFFKGPFKDMGYGIQRTRPGEHYHWHIDGGSHEFSHRQLVVIWYLNDVEGPGGETEFLYQQTQVRPEEGKLIVFPPFWTHEHRGVTLQRGVKYIATTWVVFA